MSIRSTRSQGTSGIAEKRFIRKVLQEEGENIFQSQNKRMSKFKSPEWFQKRGMKADETRLAITSLKRHRFVDMSIRNTKTGRKKKKSYPIYNKVMFGHLAEIVKKISFGFTEEIMAKMKNLEE